MLCTGINIGCVLAFFCPSMGLFDLLQLSVGQKYSFSTELDASMFTADQFKQTFKIQTSYLCLFGVLLLNLWCVFWVKLPLSIPYRKKVIGCKWEALRHMMNNVLETDVFSDWSEENGTFKDYEKMRKRNCIEFAVMALINWAIRMLMFVPLWILGTLTLLLLS